MLARGNSVLPPRDLSILPPPQQRDYPEQQPESADGKNNHLCHLELSFGLHFPALDPEEAMTVGARADGLRVQSARTSQ